MSMNGRGRRGGRDVAAHIHSVAITQWPLCSRLSRLQKQLCGRTNGRTDRAGLVFAMHYLYPLACVHTGPSDKRISPVASLQSRFTLQQQSSFPARKVARGSRQSFSFVSVSTKVSKLIGRLIFPLQFVRNGGLNLSLYLTQL